MPQQKDEVPFFGRASEAGADSRQSSFSSGREDAHLAAKTRAIRAAASARAGLAALALLMALTVLAISANTLAVYQRTHVPAAFMLALWPSGDALSLAPSVALIVGAACVLLANAAALAVGRVRALRSSSSAVYVAHSLALPLAGLAAALVAVIFYYAANASSTADTVLSWTCRWSGVPMTQQPRWDSLCRQGHAALSLAVLLIPVEVAAVALAAWQLKLEKYTRAYMQATRKNGASSGGGSPVMA